MIISHEHRFIFIKTIKTAGTSIEVYLSPHCGPNDILTPIEPPEQGHTPRNAGSFYNHYSAWGVRDAVSPDVWNNYFKFCVERNPWDKTVSHYSMIHYRSGGRVSFDDYMRAGRFCRSWDLYTDSDNRTLLMDEVLRYEQLDRDLGRVFDRLGVPWNGTLDVRAKSGFRTDRRPYQEWFSNRHRKIIDRAFANEIESFGYEF